MRTALPNSPWWSAARGLLWGTLADPRPLGVARRWRPIAKQLRADCEDLSSRVGGGWTWPGATAWGAGRGSAHMRNQVAFGRYSPETLSGDWERGRARAACPRASLCTRVLVAEGPAPTAPENMPSLSLTPPTPQSDFI